MIAQLIDGAPVHVTGQIELAGEVFVSQASVELWSEAERNTAGLYTVVDPTPPEGQVIASYGGLSFAAGVVTREATFADAPPLPRRELPKSTVYARLKALGKVPALIELFGAQPQIAYEWNMPGWPNIFADDEQLLGALAYIGCTAGEIATVTAE